MWVLMKILITAGGTSEKIDEVRCITNHSTGSMGKAIAQAFLSIPSTEEIIYVCGQTAAAPEEESKVRIARIAGVADLQDILTQILTREKIDAVVHCMAVSDYTVSNVTSTSLAADRAVQALSGADLSAEAVREILRQALNEQNQMAGSGKISSDEDDLVLVLKRTPKIIDFIKKVQPQTLLVGFKLLNHVPVQELIAAGLHLIERSGCDFVLANDKTEVTQTRHHGYLICPDGSYRELDGRSNIAKTIASSVREKLSEQEGIR